jgi:hypothetical protein
MPFFFPFSLLDLVRKATTGPNPFGSITTGLYSFNRYCCGTTVHIDSLAVSLSRFQIPIPITEYPGHSQQRMRACGTFMLLEWLGVKVPTDLYVAQNAGAVA